MLEQLFPVSGDWAKRAWASQARYEEMYRRSIDDPEGFWAEHAARLDWIKKPARIKDVDFTGDVRIRWYWDGVLNAAANCIDRHLPKRANQTAILWEGDDPKTRRRSPTRNCTSRCASSPTR